MMPIGTHGQTAAGAALALLALVVAWGLGGLDGPGLAIAPAAPLAATALAGRRAGWTAALATAAGLGVLLLLAQSGRPAPGAPGGAAGRWAGAGLAAAVCLLAASLAARNERRSQARLEAESVRDPLTGLANRRWLDETLARECRRARRTGEDLTLVVFDLDHLAAFNQAYGRAAGDRCLRRVARRLGAGFRRATDLVARPEGGTFAALLPGTPLEDARRMADDLRAAVAAAAWKHRGAPGGTLTLSGGVASATSEDQLVPRDLLTRAERALAMAKSGGRNRTTSADQL